MYRNMYLYKYLLLSDFDEAIIPLWHNKLQDMMKQLENKTNGKLVSQFVFRNYLFVVDKLIDPDYADDGMPVFSTFLRSRKRLQGSPHLKRFKPIINPRGCVATNNHMCQNPIHRYKPGAPDHVTVTSMETDVIGRNQHYRRNTCTKPNPIVGLKCHDKVDGNILYPDDMILKYKDDLIRRMETKIKLLQL